LNNSLLVEGDLIDDNHTQRKLFAFWAFVSGVLAIILAFKLRGLAK
jgi:hypothetical protein